MAGCRPTYPPTHICTGTDDGACRSDIISSAYSETKPASAHKTPIRVPGPPWTYGYSRLQAHCHRLMAPSAHNEQKPRRLRTSRVHAFRGHEVLTMMACLRHDPGDCPGNHVCVGVQSAYGSVD